MTGFKEERGPTISEFHELSRQVAELGQLIEERVRITDKAKAVVETAVYWYGLAEDSEQEANALADHILAIEAYIEAQA